MELEKATDSPALLWDWLREVGLPQSVRDVVVVAGYGRAVADDQYVEDDTIEFDWEMAVSLSEQMLMAGEEPVVIMELVRSLRDHFPALRTGQLLEVTAEPVPPGSFTPTKTRVQLTAGLTDESVVELCWFWAAHGRACIQAKRFEEGLRAFPSDFAQYLSEYLQLGVFFDEGELLGQVGRIYDETAAAAMVYSRLLGYFDGVAARPEFASEVVERQRRMEAMMRAHFGLSLRTQEDVSALREDARQMSDLLLDTVLKLEAAADRISDESFRRERDWLLERLTRRAEAEVIAEAKQLAGEQAWGLLDPESGRELRVYVLLKRDWKSEFARFAGLALCMAFERELRLAMERHGIPRSELEQPLSRLLFRAYGLPDSEHLHVIAGKARKQPGLDTLRDKAAHPKRRTFGPDDLEAVESRLFKEGLDGHGLLSNVVMSERADR